MIAKILICDCCKTKLTIDMEYYTGLKISDEIVRSEAFNVGWTSIIKHKKKTIDFCKECSRIENIK